MSMTVADILEDIKSGKYYNFTIKPLDEDEQSYYPSKRKNGKWLVVAFCFLRLIRTKHVISRLTSRLDARVIEARKPKQQSIS